MRVAYGEALYHYGTTVSVFDRYTRYCIPSLNQFMSSRLDYRATVLSWNPVTLVAEPKPFLIVSVRDSAEVPLNVLVKGSIGVKEPIRAAQYNLATEEPSGDLTSHGAY